MRCTFCKRKKAEVGRLIAGPSVFICDSCVGFAVEVVGAAVVPADSKPVPLDCSFCGKSAAQVEKLVAGPGVHICDGCISLCDEILAQV